MQHFLFVFSLFFIGSVFGQKVPEMTPTIGELVDLSKEKEQAFNAHQATCTELWEKVSKQVKLTKEESLILENCSETEEDFWNIIGGGCSWYCGGGEDTNTASSYLKPTKLLTYEPENIHDLSYKTAWVEGVPGYGIGEYVDYHFPPQTPRITTIKVINGYVKSDQVWKDNSRVKTLNMYLNGELFAILHLEDCKNEQSFHFEPIGSDERENWDLLLAQPWWTIRFEIAEVYTGDRYEDTAITEIYFDGIDVH